MLKYMQIAADLKDRVAEEHKAGDKLPSETKLADGYAVNRRTVRRALELLEQEGLIVRQHGRGTFITDRKEKNNVFKMAYVGQTTEDYYRELHWMLAHEAQVEKAVITSFNTAHRPVDELADSTELHSIVEEANALVCDTHIWPQLAGITQNTDKSVVQLTDHTGQVVESVENRPTYVLSTDMMRAARAATQRLIACGCRRIALVCIGRGKRLDSGRAEVRRNLLTYLGYMAAVRSESEQSELVLGIRPTKMREWEDHSWQQLNENAINSFLDSLDAPPDGFVCENDFRAVPLLRVMRERGLEAPRDFSVVGIANTSWCELLHPRLTSVSLGQEQIARLAVVLAREQTPQRQTVLHMRPWLIERESTAPINQHDLIGGKTKEEEAMEWQLA